ncbi:PREDICTED: melanoma-associated antigen B10-like [Propithecus coquereli]|uniref:melanoma-associated antigen B10-like n=1 Tax=Propithecus coquereli TaxID=379532 RepID=UPI00063FD2A6|nr:PREDICTED: melanoma-associated antigen B10-like [Propithecus coquereli]
MPQGLKSKLRAREKCRQRSTASGTTRNPQGPQRATTTGAAVSYIRSNETVNNQTGERPRSLQARPATEYVQRNHVDEKVFILVYYLLYKYQLKEQITKVDMVRNIIQMHKSHFHEILKRAAGHLETVFGLDMKEVDPNRHIYVLINKLYLSYDAMMSYDRGIPKTGLLMTVLGVIFTKGNCATEGEIWQMLNVMGLYEGRMHFIFGEPRKLLPKDWVEENYLVYQQVANSDPPRYEFLWHPRAYAETTKMQVLEFLAKVHDTFPSAFSTWYEEALRDEEERAQARVVARARISAMASARSRAMSCSFPHP